MEVKWTGEGRDIDCAIDEKGREWLLTVGRNTVWAIRLCAVQERRRHHEPVGLYIDRYSLSTVYLLFDLGTYPPESSHDYGG